MPAVISNNYSKYQRPSSLSYLLLFAVHDCRKGVRSGLGPNADSGIVFLEEIADEGSFPGGVLPHEEDHGFGVEVGIVEGRGDELVKVVAFFQGQQLRCVHLLESVGHGGVEMGLLRPALLEETHLENSRFPLARRTAQLGRIVVFASLVTCHSEPLFTLLFRLRVDRHVELEFTDDAPPSQLVLVHSTLRRLPIPIARPPASLLTRRKS